MLDLHPFHVVFVLVSTKPDVDSTSGCVLGPIRCEHVCGWRLIHIEYVSVFSGNNSTRNMWSTGYKKKENDVICRIGLDSVTIWIFGQWCRKCVPFFTQKANCIFMLTLIQSYGSMIFIELRIRWHIGIIHLQAIEMGKWTEILSGLLSHNGMRIDEYF